MAVALHLDVHVPQAIADQLPRLGVDVLTAIEDGCATIPDDQLLERASSLGRVMFTQDIPFRALAEDWQREGRPISGLLFGHQLGATIGRFVNDLELIARASELNGWRGQVGHLPF
jgi:hypothetical protein